MWRRGCWRPNLLLLAFAAGCAFGVFTASGFDGAPAPVERGTSDGGRGDQSTPIPRSPLATGSEPFLTVAPAEPGPCGRPPRLDHQTLTEPCNSGSRSFMVPREERGRTIVADGSRVDPVESLSLAVTAPSVLSNAPPVRTSA